MFKSLLKAAFAAVFTFALAAALQAREDSPMANRQEAMRQLTWAYRMGIRAAKKDNPEAWGKLMRYIDRAEKLDPKNPTVLAVKAEFQGYAAGKKVNAAKIKARSKAYLKMANTYKAIRSGDPGRATAYLKEAEKYEAGIAGLDLVRADIRAAKAEAGAANEKEDDDEKEEKEEK